MPVADWLEIEHTDALLVDVRESGEFERGAIPGAVNIPLSQLRARFTELPTDRGIWLYCGVGQRAYFATRFLKQCGYQVKSLSGGYMTYCALRDADSFL
jgi:rhodanese-related sulfurtransferase